MTLGHTSVGPTLFVKAWNNILGLSKNYHMEFNFESRVLNFFLNFDAKCGDHNNSTHLHGQNQLKSTYYLSINLTKIFIIIPFFYWKGCHLY